MASGILSNIEEKSNNITVEFDDYLGAEKTTTESATPVGSVNLNGDTSITYTEAGECDNGITVTDENGNSSHYDIHVVVKNAPAINGVSDKTVTVGETIDYLAGVTATDSNGEDLTTGIEVDSSAVDTNTAGSNTATYKVADKDVFTGSVNSSVTVNEKKEEVAQKAEEKPAENKKPSNNQSSSNKNNNNNNSASNSGNSGSNEVAQTPPAPEPQKPVETNTETKKPSNNQSSSNKNNNSNNNSNSASNSGNSGSNEVAQTPATPEQNNTASNSGQGNSVQKPEDIKNTVDPSIWKYDTAYAYKCKNGEWADGSSIYFTELVDAECGENRDTALYLLAGGAMSQEAFDWVYETE